jgi:hypothetical protein
MKNIWARDSTDTQDLHKAPSKYKSLNAALLIKCQNINAYKCLNFVQ